jgi:hypothetical protein
MRRTFKAAFAGACLAILLCAAPAGTVLAQAQAPAPAPATASFSDAKLNSFIDAAKKIDGVIVAWNPKIAAAKTPEEKQKVLAQAEGEALKAIEKTKGITPDEYRQINEAARQNPELAAKLDKLYQQRQ